MTTALSRHFPLEGVRDLELEGAPAGVPGVRGSTSRPIPWGLLLAMSVVAVCLTLLAASYFQAKMVTGQHQIDSVEAEIVDQQSRLQNDRVALAVEQSPVRVAQRARAIGMVDSAEPTVIAPAAPTAANPHAGETPTTDDAGTTSELALGETSGGPAAR